MDPRELVVTNSYFGMAPLSLQQTYVLGVFNSNWGIAPPVATMPGPGPRPDTDERRLRRRLMYELGDEFALLHDELLRGLAR